MKTPRALISVDDLAAILEERQLGIVDCRFSLMDPGQGRRDYEAGHIPGAVYADLDRDLAAPPTAASGRHPLPAPEEFVATLRRLGVSNDTRVVVYDEAGGGVASRLWWMLRWVGHDEVSLLNGGFAAWQRAGLPVSREINAVPEGTFDGRPDMAAIWSTEDVAELVAAGEEFVLVDARDAARFRGEREPIDAVAGHVPGARNLPFTDNLTAEGEWHQPSELARRWAEVADIAPDRPWGVMCGSGVTACHLALAAHLAGLPDPRLYVGSWSEWIRDSGRPVARVAEPRS